MTRKPKKARTVQWALLLALATLSWAGDGRANAPDDRYQPTGVAGELQDTVTGLIWMSPDDGMRYTLTAMKTRCVAPWRLPTTYELTTLLDFTQSVAPLIDLQFIRTIGMFYWTSDPTADGKYWWTVNFSGNVGGIGMEALDAMNPVRCVRDP
jgi:hypothetical protein